VAFYRVGGEYGGGGGPGKKCSPLMAAMTPAFRAR
jgi:hypothetical protein